MKGILIAVIAFLPLSIAQARTTIPTHGPEITVADILKQYAVAPTDQQDVRVNIAFENGPTPCGGDNFYHVNISFRGNIDNEPYRVLLHLGTLTMEQATKLYKAIRDNVHERGLPQCVLNDKYDSTEFFRQFNWKEVSYDPLGQSACTDAGGGTYYFPLTSCIDESRIY